MPTTARVGALLTEPQNRSFVQAFHALPDVASALAEYHTAARDLGASSMTLNVFGGNTTAIRLYETSGYTVTAQQMRREL